MKEKVASGISVLVFLSFQNPRLNFGWLLYYANGGGRVDKPIATWHVSIQFSVRRDASSMTMEHLAVMREIYWKSND